MIGIEIFGKISFIVHLIQDAFSDTSIVPLPLLQVCCPEFLLFYVDAKLWCWCYFRMHQTILLGNHLMSCLQTKPGFENWRTSRTYVLLLLLAYAWFWTCVRWYLHQFLPNNLFLPNKFSKFFWFLFFYIFKNLLLYI